MFSVQTDSGEVSIFNINIGDTVYNPYGKRVKVVGVKRYCLEEIYKITYTDGRTTFHILDDWIHTREGDIKFENIIENKKYAILDLGKVNYEMDITNPIIPDPYISGVFLTYGDMTSEYLNLPMNMTRANPFFANKYNVEYNGIPIDGLSYFKYCGDVPNNKITWKSFLKNNLDYLFTEYGILPLQYRRASLNDRWQFIRGAFDIGYDSSIFREEECGIGHKSKIKLEMIQSILWSLGIKSFIENISVENPFGWLYRLTVQEDMIVFPNLFYNNDIIETMVRNRTSVVRYPYPPLKLKIESINSEGAQSYRKLILEIPYPFLATNFIPITSLAH